VTAEEGAVLDVTSYTLIPVSGIYGWIGHVTKCVAPGLYRCDIVDLETGAFAVVDLLDDEFMSVKDGL